ncbi:MAG: ANTAR domain-containing protein [Lachnospiraceae bacterium]|nr:ANTAR domain-containing protein [Lachnospiraceae bacterium]
MSSHHQALQSVLLVSSAQKGTEFLKDLLDEYDNVEITVSLNGSDTRRRVMENTFDVILINTPLTDEFGVDLAEHLAETTVSGIVILVRNENYEEVSFRVLENGIMPVAKPLHREVFYQSLNLAVATRERLRILEKENSRLKKKLDETRLVDKAKYTLMEHMNMSEAEAHRYIEKQSMDLRLSKLSVAENILRIY